jgi:hypothetical protein
MTSGVQNDIRVHTIISLQIQKHLIVTRDYIFSPNKQQRTFQRKNICPGTTVTQIAKLFLSFYEARKLRYRTNKNPLLKLILKNTHLIWNYKSILKVFFGIIFTAKHSSRKWYFLRKIYDWKLMHFLCLRHVLHTAPIILFHLISVSLFLSLDHDSG